MKRANRSAKPRVTDTATLCEIVEEMKRKGVEADDIQRHIVSVAVVDLDQLNEVMRAA